MELIQRWNAFVKSLAMTKNAWDSLAELMVQRPNIGNMPSSVQKIMSFATVKRGSRFDVAMPRLLDHFRRYGGFEGLDVPEPEKPKKEETDGRTESRPKRGKSKPK